MSTKFYKKKILMLVAIGTVLLLIEIGVAVWMAGLITRRVEEISAKRVLLETSEQGRLQFAALQGDYQRLSGYLPQLETVFPPVENLFTMVAEMNQLAERTGNRQTLVIKGHAPQSSSFPGVSFVEFNARVEGTYGSLRTYMEELSRAPFFVTITYVDISGGETILAENKINLEGRIFLAQSKP